MLDNIHMTDIISIARLAGAAVMKIYVEDFIVSYKNDNSPLTKADTVSNTIICSALEEKFPYIPIMSEENKNIHYEKRQKWDYYWCIDPIDGTKEFINKSDDFTVNIALIHKSIPVLGVVYAPALDVMYSAKKGQGTFLNGKLLSPSRGKKAALTVVASQSHLSQKTEAFIAQLRSTYPRLQVNAKGSSLKLCMVADGSADIYPRISPTMEWDTAAAHAILLEAGKSVYIYDDTLPATAYLLENVSLVPMKYNKENLVNPNFVVV